MYYKTRSDFESYQPVILTWPTTLQQDQIFIPKINFSSYIFRLIGYWIISFLLTFISIMIMMYDIWRKLLHTMKYMLVCACACSLLLSLRNIFENAQLYPSSPKTDRITFSYRLTICDTRNRTKKKQGIMWVRVVEKSLRMIW